MQMLFIRLVVLFRTALSIKTQGKAFAPIFFFSYREVWFYHVTYAETWHWIFPVPQGTFLHLHYILYPASSKFEPMELFVIESAAFSIKVMVSVCS